MFAVGWSWLAYVWVLVSVPLGASSAAVSLQRLSPVQVDYLAADSPSCVLDGDFTAVNSTRRLYSDTFMVGSYSAYRHIEHAHWIHALFGCAAALEQANDVESHAALAYRGQFCTGHADDKVVGACLRERCRDGNESVILSSVLQTWNPAANASDVNIQDVECVETKWRIPWYRKAMPWLNIALQSSLASTVLLATLYQYWLQRSGAKADGIVRKLLLCFSARTNLAKLAKVPNDPSTTVMCLSGLRFLSMVWITVGHSYLVFSVLIENRESFVELLRNDFLAQIVINFTLSTDIFFLLSGTLSAYTWFRKIQRTPPELQHTLTSVGYWLRYYRHRIVRLWPPYAVYLLEIWALTVGYTHPFAPVLDPSRQCPTRWWQNLLFLNSLLPDLCLPWLWYLGTDFIFYLLSPVFLLAIHRRRAAGLLATAAVVVLSAGLRGVITLVYNFPPTQFLLFAADGYNADFVAHHLVIYIKPYTRIGAYLVGILLGHLLAVPPAKLRTALFAQNSVKAIVLRLTGWLVATCVGSWVLFGAYPAAQGWGGGTDVGWVVYNTLYSSVHRTVFAAAVGWFVLVAHGGGGGGWANRLLGCRPLVLLANLSYGAYIFHMVPIQSLYMWTRPFPLAWRGHAWLAVRYVAPQLAIAFAAGLLIALFVEVPALNVERLLLTGSTSRHKHTAVSLHETHTNGAEKHRANTDDVAASRPLEESQLKHADDHACRLKDNK